MKVGWLCDPGNADGTRGGAELTMDEFAAAAPKHVKVIRCPSGQVREGLDRYVFGNCTKYTPDDLGATSAAPRIKYVHDVWPHQKHPEVREELLRSARLIFTSPLHRERFPHPHNGSEIIPPAVDVEAFRRAGGRYEREGTVWLGSMQGPNKGTHLAAEWAKANEAVDFYGFGAFPPAETPWSRVYPPVSPAEVPKTLGRYERFIFLPMTLEPFGRSVVEAWAAGCELIVNRNIGALHWIENPAGLETAAQDFWEVVTRD